MSEKVIKFSQLKETSRPVIIEPPRIDTPSEDLEIDDHEEQNSGPSQEEIQRMLEEKEAEAKRKAQEILSTTQDEARQIRQEAENWAFDQVKKLNEEHEARIKEAEHKAGGILEDARLKGQTVIDEAAKEAAKIQKEAYKEGYEKGRDEGYQSGDEEVKRLIAVIHKVSGELIKRRESILNETEQELIDLVMLMTSKVVKTISETQKRVVYDNILAALGKLKIRAEVTIKVHPGDVYTVTKYKKEFMELVEGVENIRILEDPNVDKGGCIVTSEFGSIDARISTQLQEIEEQIRKLSPIKSDDALK
ncbi:MAG: flagellar assembly protein FliH [Spirochaetae bacterium HGW-Spirochaetae-6]|nr:MAG: flagellar assembly protein FliH [Spirochaetae bacterium HGW-Spirochaetae-6]